MYNKTGARQRSGAYAYKIINFFTDQARVGRFPNILRFDYK